MKYYDYHEPPFRVYGAPLFEKTGTLARLPEELTARLPQEFTAWNLARRCPGARLCFRTDSSMIYLRIDFETFSPDIGMSIYSCQSANVYVGPRPSARYMGLIRPESYDTPAAEGTILKSREMEEVTIFLPRNEVIASVQIGLEDDARIEAPTPYRHTLPILYYGNSVTEGACCSKPANAYPALLSRWLDVDFINFGFSGCARGELALADYINTIPKCALVMDYDHNAPDAAHLRATHEPFFQRIRAHSPQLPVVMLSASNVDWLPEADERRAIIRQTCENARAAGDQNVYFVDGASFWGDADRELCSADALHPNDLGMYRTAQTLRPVIEKILCD